MKILIFAFVCLSISSVAVADRLSDGIQELTAKQTAAEAIPSAEPSESPKASPAAIPVNPGEDDLRVGMQRYRDRKYAEAIGALSRYATLAPKSQQRPAALLIIGKSLEEMDRPLSALNLYNRVTERHPDTPEALLGVVAMADIGVARPGVHYRGGRKGAEYVRDPVTAYDAALSKKVPPQIIEHIHHQRGRALWKAKRYDEARKGLAAFLKQFPRTAYREETIATIIECTALLIDQHSRSGDHLAVADLFLRSWKGGFVRATDVDTLLNSAFSLSFLGLHEASGNILDNLGKSAAGRSPSVIRRIEAMAAEIERKRALGPSDPTQALAKWRQFQAGREQLNANRLALAEKTLSDLRNGDSDPFWSGMAEYLLEEDRWAKKYQGQIRR